MEQLRLPRFSLGLVIKFLLTVVALVLAVVIFQMLIRTDTPSADELKGYLKDNQLQVGVAVNGQHQQVYYLYEGKKIFITEGASNRTWAKASGNFITWLETPYQSNNSLVFLYDVLSKTKTQLTFYGTSLRPVLDGYKVVWEDHNGEKPAVMYYDGTSTVKLTDGMYPSVRPAIRGNKIAYAQEIGTDDWQVVVYDTETKQSEVFSRGKSSSAWPRFEGDNLLVDNPSY